MEYRDLREVPLQFTRGQRAQGRLDEGSRAYQVRVIGARTWLVAVRAESAGEAYAKVKRYAPPHQRWQVLNRELGVVLEGA